MHPYFRSLWILLFAITACSETNTTHSIQVPEGYELELVAGSDLLDYPMFATLDETGRLFVFESIGNVYETSEQAVESPQFRIKLLIDHDQDGKYDRATIFADKLSFPQGGVFIDGSLIVSSAPDLIKLTDIDNDGVADQREVLLSGWILNVNANSLIGPFLGPDGWLYLTSAIMGFDVNTKEGENIQGETARIWRVRPDGTDLEWISAGGMNNPVELTFTPAGEVIGTQTFFVHPQRGVRDAITYWIEGGIYGKKNSNIDRDSLPRTGDLLPVISQYSRVAPSGIGIYRSKAFGLDFQNNLFSAQFNAHQVIRHQMTRVEGSFTLQDTPFLWTENTDFHPTDVLEDADGSLMVVETGGWFILGCPLSQVSKPQLKGGIYRIKRKGATVISDPYGNDISWKKLELAQLASYLEDSRPFVSDRAQNELIARENRAISAYENLLENSALMSVRIKAIYGLYRINTTESWTAMTRGFQLKTESEKVAFARAAGLTGSRIFLENLITMLSLPEPSVVRQSAIALGQIGDPVAVESLLEVVSTQEDPFVLHAIIYSLINLNRPKVLLARLGQSAQLTRTILLAVDQMPSEILNADLVLPYLSNEAIRETALLIASRHPEWSIEIVDYLQLNLRTGQISENELEAFGRLITNYCGTLAMQEFLVQIVEDGKRPIKLLALKSMASCQLDSFPASWQSRLGKILTTSTDAGVLVQTLALINQSGLTGLTDELNRIATNTDHSSSIRIDAISCLLSYNQKFENNQFYFIGSLLSQNESPILSQKAAITLASASLSDEQLFYLTNEVLPGIDTFLLPRLLPAYEGAKNLKIGNQLLTYLMEMPSLDNFTEEYIKELFSNYPSEIQPSLEVLLSKLSSVRNQRIERITDLERSLSEGSEERGRALYFGKALCSTCHTVRQGGGTLGPDLTSIQKDRSVHDIIEAIVYPSASFVREYETYEITTVTNEYRGVIKEQTPDMVLLETAPGTMVRIPTSEIQNIQQLEVSIMPQGLDQLLTEEEFNDLIAYLMAKDLEY